MALEITVRDDYLHPENEWFPGFLDRIEEDEGQFGPMLKWVFILDTEPEREAWGFTSQTLSPRSKAYGWIKGIYSQGPEPGQVVDLGQLFGERVGVMFEHREGENGPTDRIVKVKGLGDKPKQEPTNPPVTNKALPF